jgi:hypothetical protein
MRIYSKWRPDAEKDQLRVDEASRTMAATAPLREFFSG